MGVKLQTCNEEEEVGYFKSFNFTFMAVFSGDLNFLATLYQSTNGNVCFFLRCLSPQFGRDQSFAKKATRRVLFFSLSQKKWLSQKDL